MTAARPAPATSQDLRRLVGWRAAAVWLAVGIDLAAMAAAIVVAPERPDTPLWAVAIFVLMAASFGLVTRDMARTGSATVAPAQPAIWLRPGDQNR